MIKDIKVGDRVVVGTWNIPIYISRIYFIDYENNEVSESKSSTTMLELNWGEHGKSKVALHDQNKTWHRFLDLN